jgi:transcriptional regulator with XRE-family HTH domain
MTLMTPAQQIATRLEQALTQSGLSKRAFQARLKGRRVVSTPPTIDRYLSGEREPSAAWLIDAARVLAVRPEWLLTGDASLGVADLLSPAGLQKVRRLQNDQLIEIAPGYIPRADRMRFGELVKRACLSLEIDAVQARALIIDMLAAPLAVLAARLTPAAVAASHEDFLRVLVTTGRLTNEYLEMALASDYISDVLRAFERAIPTNPPKVVASRRALARLANVTVLDLNPKGASIVATPRSVVKARTPRKPRTSK